MQQQPEPVDQDVAFLPLDQLAGVKANADRSTTPLYLAIAGREAAGDRIDGREPGAP